MFSQYIHLVFSLIPQCYRLRGRKKVIYYKLTSIFALVTQSKKTAIRAQIVDDSKVY